MACMFYEFLVHLNLLERLVSNSFVGWLGEGYYSYKQADSIYVQDCFRNPVINLLITIPREALIVELEDSIRKS